MIDVAGDVPTWTPVYSITVIELKQILRRVFFDRFVRLFDADVFDDKIALLEGLFGLEAKSSFGPDNGKVLVIFYFFHAGYSNTKPARGRVL